MLPKETLSELLNYLVEHEEFSSIKNLGSVSLSEVRSSLKELADELKREALQETHPIDLSHVEELSPQVKKLLKKLSPKEVEILSKQFGLE